MKSYISLGIAELLPVIVSLLFYYLNEKTSFGKLKYKYKQIIYGIVFGGLAVIGTDFGIPINGAQVNCRDAAVLAGGLLFGAPTGIIAGTIGGIERWFSVYWGIGAYTQLACSLSTFIAGIYAALLRKFMFENKAPGTFISLAIGVVMEVFHMMTVFLTHMDDPEKAMGIVKICSVIMIPANGFSVMLSVLVVYLVSRKKNNDNLKTGKTRISQIIQRRLLLAVLFAFSVTTLFLFKFQDEVAVTQADNLLQIALDETTEDIYDASNKNLLSAARTVSTEIKDGNLKELAEKYGLAEVTIVNDKGVIVKSSYPGYIGFDFNNGEQSSEFLCLLGDTEEFVQGYGPISSTESTTRKYAGIKLPEGGFLQVGYSAEDINRDIGKYIANITKNRHVGKTGNVIILDNSFKVTSAPDSVSTETIEKATHITKIPDENTTFNITVDGAKYRCRYKFSEGCYIISVLPEKEAIELRDTSLYINTFLEVLVFALLFAMIYFLIKKVVVNQIKTVNNSLAKITDGDLDEVVNVRTSEEFSSLSDDINSTVDTLKTYIAEASARIDAELELAKNIQASALPTVSPVISRRKDFDIFASMNPAKEVGGDFYDFYITNGNTLNFLVADVSGKGIPAAMFMMRAMTELKSLTEAGQAINDVFTNGNNALCNGNDAGMFVTAWQAGIELLTGNVKYANAGHNPPVIRHGNGKFEYLKARSGFVLAGMEGFNYKMQEFRLEPGDIIYLYTDGVTEATDANNELFGEDRLLDALNSKEFDSMEELCIYVKSEVDKFVGEAPQFDDITMVALKYIGTPSIHFDNAKGEDVEAVTEFAETELEKIGCPLKAVMQINIAIDEIFSNIVRYGYENTTGPVTVKIIHNEEKNCVYIRFEDEGIPYNPLAKEDPDVTLSAEERSIGGLGIFVVKKTMDDVKYRYENGKNVLTLKKFLK